MAVVQENHGSSLQHEQREYQECVSNNVEVSAFTESERNNKRPRLTIVPRLIR